MEWDVLETKIRSWLHAVKIAVKNIFYGERVLCDSVFSSSGKIAESCFVEISRDAAITLFGFPENFAKSKKILSPEKMFRALDLYEAISDLWTEIEMIFSYDSLSAVKSQAVASVVKLGESIRDELFGFAVWNLLDSFFVGEEH
ncbi:exocyst subunit exo70 family protein H4 [Abeliophyllum distichum]|uniref:Exocyst subunit Exo70 family protein n=1 Tax=Abeliophyllum distichum TaxID=126358 RepID=A0ABD1U2X1_9LAMI